MINIYVEGNPDISLIEGIIKKEFPQTKVGYSIVSTKGYTNISKFIIPSQENRDEGGVNLVLFDADNSGHKDGGVIKRKQYLMAQNEFIDDIFLFPNDSDDGDIEILLEKIVNRIHQQVIDSFNQFQQDIGNKVFSNIPAVQFYEVPAQKAKIYSYADILLRSYKTQGLRLDVDKLNLSVYCLPDKDFWNFDSPELQPLINFLARYFG